MDNKLKHLEFIQNVIVRMNNESIQLKTWTILLVVGVLTLAEKQGSWFIILCATSVQDKFTKQAPVATSKQEVSPVAAEEQKQTIRTNPFVQTNTL